MLVGMLLAFLGVVSASPTGTPTTPEGATPASLGLRRNGFSDLPSDVIGYNGVQPENRIPDYVVANDPDEGNDAIIYTREEIYTAMQVGAIYKSEQPVLGANRVLCVFIAGIRGSTAYPRSRAWSGR